MNGFSGSPAAPLLPGLLFALWAVLHSCFADSRVKERFFARFGAAARRFYRIIYILLSIAGLALILYTAVRLPGRVLWSAAGVAGFVPTAVRVVAAVLLLVVSGGTDAADFLGWNALVGRHVDPVLKTDGAYALVRHPSYTLGFVVIWSAPSMTLGGLILSVAASLYLWLGTYHEEKGLVETFGGQYEEYRRRVGRLVPRLRKRG